MLQYSTFTRIIYNRYTGYKLDAAAALALVLVLDDRVHSLFRTKRARSYAIRTYIDWRGPQTESSLELGWWKIPALVFVGGTVVMALVIPAAGLVYWFARGWQQDLGC